MGIIARLPEAVANQIAAGEVVERPASVVKELLENAIDAGATRIEIDVIGGGVELIRITDDGTGMSRDDAALALERHATSKIREAADLSSISTLGFRGEALPSIASVSRFSMVTRTRENDEGTRLLVEGGKTIDVSAAGAAAGTQIEVRDLFYNVPARRKFLKTTATEMSHISEAVSRLALARPNVAFKLTSEGRIVVDVPPAQPNDPRGRIGRILGRAIADRLYPIAREEKPRSVSVSGFVSAPELSERTARGLWVFVNRRYVRDRTIQHAIEDGYRTLLERGRHPLVVLSVEMDPARVDVNVHPQKTEVRFEQTGEIHRAVSNAITRTLEGQPWLPKEAPSLQSNIRRYALTSTSGGAFEEHRSRVEDAARALGRIPYAAEAWEARPADVSHDAFRTFPRQLENEAVAGRFRSLEPVGQVMATYLVCQGPGRMVVIDQHAAHERIAFERMRKQAASKSVSTQPLLVPLSLELDASRSAVAHDARDRLLEIGIEMENFGGNTWLVKSRPTAIGSADLQKLVVDLLDEVKDVGQTTPLREVVESMLSCAACHTVVRAGDRLTTAEIKELLIAMDEIDFGAHCPHGRPVFVEWSEKELAGLFHRT
jgi:DNA mismatch repair protein MutL